MSRLTEEMLCACDGCELYYDCDDGTYSECEKRKFYEKVQYYEDLEEQLEKLYGGRLSLDNVIDNLNRIVQNGEEKLDYARILTNAEAEKWDRWKSLEEQGRLAVLPCPLHSRIYKIDKYDGIIESVFNYIDIPHFGKTVFLTKEEAEAKLEELKNE